MPEPTAYTPTPLPQVPPGTTVAYLADGTPVYVPAATLAAQQQAPLVIQAPTEPIPTWLRNGLLAAVGVLVLCTPAAVLLIVAGPALVATGQAVAYGGIGIGVSVIGVAAAIKSLRETPRQARPARTGLFSKQS
ncbi:hypothetical protein ABZ697_30875 [Streptomyces albidoflavus]|uniref:hypothetical protein n=1 Tax=Streptomyces albidoflavus TaxID=1886 RepID=UPI0033FE829D